MKAFVVSGRHLITGDLIKQEYLLIPDNFEKELKEGAEDRDISLDLDEIYDRALSNWKDSNFSKKEIKEGEFSYEIKEDKTSIKKALYLKLAQVNKQFRELKKEADLIKEALKEL